MLNFDKTHFRRWELAALLALCLGLCICTWAQGRQRSISSSLVRLHVIAHSDSEAEQALKLRVRDAVLEYLAPALAEVSTQEEARSVIEGELPGIRRAAALVSEGREVTVTLSRESYPTRRYDGFTLPAGEYQSLRVTLGRGQGRNWWCIVFPPVCLPASQGDTVSQVMAPEDYALVSGEEGYELRFRAVELWGELMEKLK